MLNRYSTLPKVNIKDTQALPDLGIYDNTLARKQQKYDTKAAALGSAIQSAETLPVFGNAANAKKNQVVNDVKAKVGELTNMDLGDPNVTRGTDQYLQQLASDPELKKHVQAKQYYDKFQEQAEDLSLKGKAPTSRMKLQNMYWNQYSESGQLPSEATKPLYEAQDLVEGRGKLVNMLKANGGDAIAYLADGTAYKNSSKGVNGSRIAKAVDDQLNAYANSAYGIQEKDDWQVAKLEGSIPESMSFKDYLRKEVMSTAQNYEYSDFSTNKDGAINASRKDAEEKRKEEETIMTGTEGFNTGIIPTDMQFNSGNGQIREQNTVKSWLLGPIFGDQDLTEESKQKAENQQVMLAAKAHNMTPKEYAEKFGKTQNIAVHNYVKDSKRQDLTKLVNNDGAGLLNSAEIVDSEGNRTTLKDFAIKNGSGESAKEVNEWIKENGIQVTGKIDPSAPSAEGYRISMGGNDYIMDLTKNLERKKASGTITKLEQAKLDAHEQERYKAGYVEPVQTAEGPAVRYWDFEKGGYATKPI